MSSEAVQYPALHVQVSRWQPTGRWDQTYDCLTGYVRKEVPAAVTLTVNASGLV